MAIVDVKVEISGNVWKIEAEIGQAVSEDETIMILESMKMEIPVLVPQTGKIIEILVSEGDNVADEDVVARIEV